MFEKANNRILSFLKLHILHKLLKQSLLHHQLYKILCVWLCWWLSGKKICLPVQETQVRSLIWEEPTCLRATKPTHPRARASKQGKLL